MEYLQMLSAKLFGTDEGCEKSDRKVVLFGNVLLDHAARLPDTSLLERHNLKLKEREELAMEKLFDITADTCESAKCTRYAGGAALSTARILQHLGTDVYFLGAVGQDKSADLLKTVLKEHGVSASLQVVNDVPTGQCVTLVCGDGTALYSNCGASLHFTVDHLKTSEGAVCERFLRPDDRKQILYIEGFFLPQRTEVCEFIVEHYIKHRRRLALNLSDVHIVEQNFKTILYLAESAYFLFGNEKEFNALADLMGCKSFEEAATKLLDGHGSKILAITNGAEGVTLISNFLTENDPPGEIVVQQFKAPQADVVLDTTGCGDAFVAGFLHSWLEKRSLSECVRGATDIAAKVASEIGCNLPQSER